VSALVIIVRQEAHVVRGRAQSMGDKSNYNLMQADRCHKTLSKQVRAILDPIFQDEMRPQQSERREFHFAFTTAIAFKHRVQGYEFLTMAES
jgi:hypothetical protein